MDDKRMCDDDAHTDAHARAKGELHVGSINKRNLPEGNEEIDDEKIRR